MLPFKKILCPTDFSEPSFIALNAAIEFAQQYGAELHILHIVPPLHMVPVPTNIQLPIYEQELREAAQRAMAECIQDRVPSSLQVVPSILWGQASQEIVSYAEEKGVDLLVIATHGHSGWKRFMFGSVTEKVARTASCPTLIIHPSKQ